MVKHWIFHVFPLILEKLKGRLGRQIGKEVTGIYYDKLGYDKHREL